MPDNQARLDGEGGENSVRLPERKWQRLSADGKTDQIC